MSPIIQVNGLKRDFTLTEGIFKKKKRVVEAIKGIDFAVPKGEIFGLLGPNGAGKTTTIKVLTTLLLPSAGEVRIFGQDVVKDVAKIRSRINFIFGGERSLYWRLSAEDNLRYFADLYKIEPAVQKKKIPELLEMVGLTDRAKTKVETFSKGMKQRLHIARGMINDPEVLFLDEPTIGLDPEASLEMRKLIMELKNQGKTILLTTHYLLEADYLCDRIGVINHGEIVALDTPKGLKRLVQGSTLEVTVFGLGKDALQGLKSIAGVKLVDLVTFDQNQLLRIHTENLEGNYRGILTYLESKQVQVINVMSRDASLEDAYLKILGGVA